MIESLLDWISQHAKFEAESGANNNWNWVKYTDGTSEATYKRTLRLNFDTQYGGIYFASQTIEEIYMRVWNGVASSNLEVTIEAVIKGRWK